MKMTQSKKNRLHLINFGVSLVASLGAYYLLKSKGKNWKQRIPYAAGAAVVSAAIDVVIKKM